MALPRPVFRETFYMVTRRCTQRQFLLRPDETTNNTYLYCLAEAALRCGIVVLLTQMMSNHHHTVVYDPFGRINEFTEHFHKLFAHAQNRHRGRRENMWSNEPPCLVELIERKDVIRKMVYVATNPVKDRLVERVHHWPGPATYAAFAFNKTVVTVRPRHFFRSRGKMPATVSFKFEVPAILGDAKAFRAEVIRRVEMAEKAFADTRRRKGQSVMGRSAVLRQCWWGTPAVPRPRRKGEIRPTIAAQSRWARVASLQHRSSFLIAYEYARQRLLAGDPVPFPPGTYWLRRFANVPVLPDPPRRQFN